MRAPSFIVITGASIARQAAWAAGKSTPSRANLTAGSTRRGHGSVRSASALFEDLDSGIHRCGMSRRHSRLHRAEAIALEPLGCMVVDAGAHPALVHARALVKRFDDLVAVDGVDFDVQRGEAF